jgi:hypothetical protein
MINPNLPTQPNSADKMCLTCRYPNISALNSVVQSNDYTRARERL